jgi:hypothetical protein
MGTLTMALAAVLVAGSAPEKVPGETRQVLDMRGEWEGAFFLDRDSFHCRLARNTLYLQNAFAMKSFPIRFSNAGEGKLIVGLADLPLALGVWQQRGDCVIVSFRCQVRGEAMVVLELHRLKPHN